MGEIRENLRENLSNYLSVKGVSQKQLAEKLDVSQSAVTNWVKGNNSPDIETVAKICDVLNISVVDLFGSNGSEMPERIQKVMSRLPLYDLPVSAGLGEWLLDGCEYEYTDFEDVPKNAEFALRVRGNSMEPMYSDGDIVFVRSRIRVESGQVGVFYFNGSGYLKMLQGDKLISFNPEYKPIVMGEFDEYVCFGRVVGKTTP